MVALTARCALPPLPPPSTTTSKTSTRTRAHTRALLEARSPTPRARAHNGAPLRGRSNCVNLAVQFNLAGRSHAIGRPVGLRAKWNCQKPSVPRTPTWLFNRPPNLPRHAPPACAPRATRFRISRIYTAPRAPNSPLRQPLHPCNAPRTPVAHLLWHAVTRKRAGAPRTAATAREGRPPGRALPHTIRTREAPKEHIASFLSWLHTPPTQGAPPSAAHPLRPQFLRQASVSPPQQPCTISNSQPTHSTNA